MNALKNFIEKNGLYNCRYSNEYKERFAKAGRQFCNELEKLLELDEFHFHYNKAGMACSGDISFFGKKNGKCFYLHFNTDGVCGLQGYYRTAKSFSDYTGGANNWFRLDSTTETITNQIMRIL